MNSMGNWRNSPHKWFVSPMIHQFFSQILLVDLSRSFTWWNGERFSPVHRWWIPHKGGFKLLARSIFSSKFNSSSSSDPPTQVSNMCLKMLKIWPNLIENGQILWIHTLCDMMLCQTLSNIGPIIQKSAILLVQMVFINRCTNRGCVNS